MTQAILTINAGSSSIKFALFALESGQPIPEQAAVIGQVDGIGAKGRLVAKDPAGRHEQALDLAGDQAAQHAQAMDFVLRWITEHETGWQIAAVGHRVVHGGEIHSEPVVLNDDIVGQLGRFIVLAPLHQPHNLNGIRAISRLLPEVPQVACFDTAFHRAQPSLAQAFALPAQAPSGPC